MESAMRSTRHLLHDLDEQECRVLLGSATFGRLAFTQDALPMILPSHFRIRGDEVVVTSVAASPIASARNGHVVVFEVDAYEPATREGWSVSVIGPSRLVVDPSEIAELDRLDFSPLSARSGWHYIAVRIGVLRGSRLVLVSAEEPDARADDHGS
jgi:nitroimidazol reductase NimA-like FMN-containing flavoprotein (pyridoxamine 5'-phosphate oxidase superfamily)